MLGPGGFRGALAALALGSILGAAATQASAAYWASGSLVGVDVYDRQEGRSLEVYRRQGDDHNIGMMMVYLPKEKVLVEADDFTPAPANAPFPGPRSHAVTVNLLGNVQNLKLDVMTIAPLHGVVAPFTELQKAAGNG